MDTGGLALQYSGISSHSAECTLIYFQLFMVKWLLFWSLKINSRFYCHTMLPLAWSTFGLTSKGHLISSLTQFWFNYMLIIAVDLPLTWVSLTWVPVCVEFTLVNRNYMHHWYIESINRDVYWPGLIFWRCAYMMHCTSLHLSTPVMVRLLPWFPNLLIWIKLMISFWCDCDSCHQW